MYGLLVIRLFVSVFYLVFQFVASLIGISFVLCSWLCYWYHVMSYSCDNKESVRAVVLYLEVFVLTSCMGEGGEKNNSNNNNNNK